MAGATVAVVYSEVEPFEGWKPVGGRITRAVYNESIARSNPLRDGNLTLSQEKEKAPLSL